MDRPEGLRHQLSVVEAFANLSDAELEQLESLLQVQRVSRGEILLRQGELADTLYLVLFGRFQVKVAERAAAIAEIGAGKPIGEIGFFAGGLRTATVVAVRDSLVLRLKREDFEALCARVPDIWATITATLASRLAQMTTAEQAMEMSRPRTIAICHAGEKPLSDDVLERLKSVFLRRSRCYFLSSSALKARFKTDQPADDDVTRWLNEEEAKLDYLVFVADQELTDWSARAIRQGDLVLFLGMHGPQPEAGPVPLNPLERFCQGIHEPASQRLVLVHEAGRTISGTDRWLANRPVAMHHHVAAGSLGDYERLFRFINGDATGLVACGGGAFCAAHVGVFKALLESGLEFDIMGGTSGGAAMAGALALGVEPDEIDRRTHDIFVVNGALRRATWPRYSLLDHTVFDRCLAEHYTEALIEDLRVPYFAMSTNLSGNGLHCHRTGSLWRAIRASSAIPGLLPPVYTSDGDALVDGSLLDNVPVRQMCQLKQGPNVIINFEPPEFHTAGVDYASLPSRGRIVRSLLFPYLSRPLPRAPSAGSILMRSLTVNRPDFRQHVCDDDLVVVPPIPKDVSILDWQHHSRLMQLAYEHTLDQVSRLKAKGHRLLTASRDRDGVTRS